MGMVRPATSLGRSGLHDWLIQRLSAVVLVVYALILAVYFAGHPGADQPTWVAFISQPVMKVATLLALLAVVAHAWIGIWTVFTDYVKPAGLRLVLQSGLIVVCLSLLLWGLVIVWGV